MFDQNSSCQRTLLSAVAAPLLATTELLRRVPAVVSTEATHETDSQVSSRPGPGEDRDDWTVETSVTASDSLTVGDSVRFTKRLEESDARAFAAASGDTNPLHFEDGTHEQFDGAIAHGLLVSGLISAALARFPGTVVYLSQDVTFHNPVYLGDRVTADVEIVEDLGEDRFRLQTTVENGTETAVDGEAVVIADQ